MKCTVEKNSLLEHLRKVCNIINRKAQLPILANLLLTAQDGELILTATNLEITVNTRLKAEIFREGKTTLPAKSLLALVENLPGTNVSLDCDQRFHSTITGGNAEFLLHGLDPADFPEINLFAPEWHIRLKQTELTEMIDSVACAVSKDHSCKTLQGILFTADGTTLTAVGTDGKRLALMERSPEKISQTGNVILPFGAAQEIRRLLGAEGAVDLELNHRFIRIGIGDTTLLAKLLEGTYPNFRQVIPASFSQEINISGDALRQALELVSAPLSGNCEKVTLTFRKNELELCTQSDAVGSGKTRIELAFPDDQEFEIILNIQYLLSPLKSDHGQLKMRMDKPDTPIGIDGEDGFRYIIMPIREK